MSMPSVIYSCDHCDFTVGETRLWGNYTYLIDGLRVPLSITTGWCHECRSITPIEDFRDSAEIIDRLRGLTNRLARLHTRPLYGCWNALAFWKRTENRREWDETRALLMRLELIEARRGQEKCLFCGCDRVEGIPGDLLLEYDAGSHLYRGSARSEFVHPGCGGRLVIRPSEMRFHIRIETRRYDWNGNRLAE